MVHAHTLASVLCCCGLLSSDVCWCTTWSLFKLVHLRPMLHLVFVLWRWGNSPIKHIKKGFKFLFTSLMHKLGLLAIRACRYKYFNPCNILFRKWHEGHLSGATLQSFYPFVFMNAVSFGAGECFANVSAFFIFLRTEDSFDQNKVWHWNDESSGALSECHFSTWKLFLRLRQASSLTLSAFVSQIKSARAAALEVKCLVLVPSTLLQNIQTDGPRVKETVEQSARYLAGAEGGVLAGPAQSSSVFPHAAWEWSSDERLDVKTEDVQSGKTRIWTHPLLVFF